MTARHNYGPFSETYLPLVIIGYGANEKRVPLPQALIDQRRQINAIARGQIAKSLGQQAALDAHPDDRAKVEAAIRKLAATGRPFSANDARSIHGVRGGVVGATFTALRKERVIEPCGDDTSSSESTHGHRIFLWRAAA